MSLMLTRGCEYALQALLYLASKPANTPILQREISDALNIPPHFLGKVLQSLSRSRLVISQRGRTGGFVLGKPPEDITPFDVIEAIDGSKFLDDCFFGFPGCCDDTPCPVHNRWKLIKEDVLEMLRAQTLAQLGSDMDAKLKFISQSGPTGTDRVATPSDQPGARL